MRTASIVSLLPLLCFLCGDAHMGDLTSSGYSGSELVKIIQQGGNTL